MTLHRFLKQNERLLSAVGAGLVLLTFVVREAIREDLRDLISSIESAQSIYLVRADSLDVVSRLVALDSRIEEGTEAKIRLGSITDLRRQQDADDWTYIRLNSTRANLADLIDRLPKQYRRQYTSRLGQLDASVKQIDDLYPAFNNGISSTNPTQAQEDQAVRLLRNVEQLLDETYQKSFQLEREVLRKAQQIRKAKETVYSWCTWVSYVTYPLGWLIGFLGALAGVKGLAGGS
jgi:hypothetical protein